MENETDARRQSTLSPHGVAHRRGVNRILSLLPKAERERILERCEKVALDIEKVLYPRGAPITEVYFPLSGMVSLVIGSSDGTTIEVGVIGNEGMAGISAALGGGTSAVKALIQTKGEFLRMKRKDLETELARRGALMGLLQRFSQALTIQISQSVLCNRAHAVEQRISRWLLMTHDRAGTDEIHLTQQFVAEMLGIRRPSVTEAATVLQKAGLIRYSRGSVTILDRAGLERSACECYGVVAGEVEALLAA